MYEKNGYKRLVYALESNLEDVSRMRMLAQVLRYCDDQLKEDIRSLVDYVESSTSSED